jgi:hypothetical protein
MSGENKPLLLINAGVAWSGTKPLCKTLQVCQKIAHHGLVVENNILYYLYLLQTNPQQAKRYFNERHNYRVRSAIDSNSRPLDLGYLEDIFKKKTTIHTYIKYHLDLWERNKKKGYLGLSDFSNSNTILSSDFLLSIKKELEKHFIVKVIIIFRDPVRRWYSEASVEYKYNTGEHPMEWKGGTADVTGYKDSIEYWKSKRIDHNCDYLQIYKNYKSVFDTYPIVMEEFWYDQSGLSDFLGRDISKVNANVYCPYIGVNKDHTPADLQELSDDDLIWGMNKLGKVYTEWEKEFGYIPQSWL